MSELSFPLKPGSMLEPEQELVTASGRAVRFAYFKTPINTEHRARAAITASNRWIYRQAILEVLEAKSNFHAALIAGLKPEMLSPSDCETLWLIVFDDQVNLMLRSAHQLQLAPFFMRGLLEEKLLEIGKPGRKSRV
jgi:hypothetical protein